MKQQNSSKQLQPNLKAHDELILVVKRATLFNDISGAWQGLKSENIDHYLTAIYNNQEFLPRSIMEQDQGYKQIIPYLIFMYQGRYFVMQRKSTSSEQRLKSKFTLGIGGHIRQEDISDDSIFNWAQREFHEEINYSGNVDIQVLGVVNDDSNDVGKVHLGLVLLLQGDTDCISIKSELKSGELKTYQECSALFDSLESWSQLILPQLS